MTNTLEKNISHVPLPIKVTKTWLKFPKETNEVEGTIAIDTYYSNRPLSLQITRSIDDRFINVGLNLREAEQLLEDIFHTINKARNNLARIILALLPEINLKGNYYRLFKLLLKTAQYFEPETKEAVNLLWAKLNEEGATRENFYNIKAGLQKLLVKTLLNCEDIWDCKAMESNDVSKHWPSIVKNKEEGIDYIVLPEYRYTRIDYTPYLVFYRREWEQS